MSFLVLCLCLWAINACQIKLDITADNELTIVQVGTNRFAGKSIPFWNDWTKAGSIYTTGDHIAIELKNWAGGVFGKNPGALLAAITVLDDNNKVYVTDSTWKCSKVSEPGWETRDFDDSKWPAAQVYGPNGGGAWGVRIAAITASASWIWTPGGNTEEDTIWCRKRNFCPPVLREPPTQSVCEVSAGGAAGGAVVVPPQKVLVLQVVPDPHYLAWSDLMVQRMREFITARYPTSVVNKQQLSDSSRLPADLDTYTQIWVYDLSYFGDQTASHLTQYRRVAQWYHDRPGKHVIVDGRILSENYAIPGYDGGPRFQVFENYFANLAIRGGGLMLGTDHDVFAVGINNINDQIGFGRFYDVIYGTKCTADTKSPLMTWPNYAPLPDGTLMDHTSTSITPFNAQPNGQILYPLCWHNARVSAPAIASTIRGDAGFTVAISNPPCDSWFPHGTAIQFRSTTKGAGAGTISYSWYSNTAGFFGSSETVTWTPPPGRHIIKLTAIDTAGLVADFFIAVTITYRSKNTECFTTEYNGKQVKELFPVRGPMSAVSYYNYAGGNAQTVAKIESTLANSANFFLYQDPSGNLSLINIMSKNALLSKYSFSMTSDLGGKGTKISFWDDPGDRHTSWNAVTGSGSSDYTFSGTTKGWVLEGLPNTPTKYFCLEIDFNQRDHMNMASAAFWALPTEDPTGKPQYWGHDVTRADKLRICRRQCSCPALDTRDQLTGTIESLTIIFGKDGSTTRYDDTESCNFRIQPVPKGGPIAGIGIHFESWSVRAGDALTVFNGPSTGPVALTANNPARPSSVRVNGALADLGWKPNRDGQVDAGWRVRYFAIPTVLSLAKPNLGFSFSANVLEINGANFVNSEKLKVFLDGVPLETTWVSDTKVTAKVPIQPYSAVGTKRSVKVTNDGVYFSNENVQVTFIDMECGSQISCMGCSANPKCSWCNNLDSLGLSYCFETASGQCTPSRQKIDKGCCTTCIPQKGCNGFGTCVGCNNTCSCDSKHWGDDCSCNVCPTTIAGSPCSGKGKCGCDGKCQCEPGFWGPDCSCRSCGGNPTCSGNGVCQCDGTCACANGWAHKIERNPICDCQTICPGNNCNGKGKCNCGVCICDWDAVGQFCQNVSICGDGKIEYNEKCDDGNKVSGDGCSNTCKREVGWDCPITGAPCVPVCGDGMLRGNEKCDDANQRNGDGCSRLCQVEDGWECRTPDGADALDSPRSLCCDALHVNVIEYNSRLSIPGQLVCIGGWWHGGNRTYEKPVNPERTLIAIDGSEDELSFETPMHICGIIEVSVPLVIDNITLYVAGAVRVLEGGSITLRNGGRLEVHDHCDGEGYFQDDQLVFSANSMVGINALWWEDPEESPEVPIWVERCASIDYDTVLHLSPSAIPRGENAMTLIWSNNSCIHLPGVESQDHEDYEPFATQDLDLPGGCSYASSDNPEDSEVSVTFYHRDLCPAQIAGISVGVFCGAVVIAGAAAYGSGAAGATGASGGDYVAL